MKRKLANSSGETEAHRSVQKMKEKDTEDERGSAVF